MILSPVSDEPVYPRNVLNRCLWSIPQLVRCFCFLCPSLLEMCTGSIFVSMWFQKSMKLRRWNIKYIVFVLFSIEYISRKRKKMATFCFFLLFWWFKQHPSFTGSKVINSHCEFLAAVMSNIYAKARNCSWMTTAEWCYRKPDMVG